MTNENCVGLSKRSAIRVLMVSTSYPRDASDWRGIFIAHLVSALGRNLDIQLDLWSPPGTVEPGVTTTTTSGEAKWLGDLMARGGISHLLRKTPLFGILAGCRLLRYLHSVYRRTTGVDIYHVNWMQCALPLPADRKPALITVLGNDLKLMRIAWIRALFRRALRNRRVAICPNATWMEAPLQSMFGDVAKVLSVPLGIDPRWYAIIRDANDFLHPPRWLAVTRLTADKLGPLFTWSEPLFRDGTRELHLFGPMQETITIPSWIHYHGAATPEQLASEWFPGACGLITLSKHAEGRPQVMLEAMASALPIIASRMSAHADIVTDGTTGALCDTEHDYAAAVKALEEPGHNFRVGTAARAWVSREIGTWDDCAERYITIYQQLLGQSGHG